VRTPSLQLILVEPVERFPGSIADNSSRTVGCAATAPEMPL